MTQFYIIRMIKIPDAKNICLNQEQYDELISILKKKDIESSRQIHEVSVRVETLNDRYCCRGKDVSCDEASYRASLAMHMHIEKLHATIRKMIKDY